MSLFEEYLTRGFWMREEERLAIYKYLLKTKSHTYRTQANKLLNEKFLQDSFANGEIAYSLHKGIVSFKTRKKGESDFEGAHRSIRLSKFEKLSVSKLIKFFAQAEVDILRNYPICSDEYSEERSYAMNVYPYYDLNYYSNGDGKAKGLLKKIQSKDDELLEKLLAS